MTDSINLAAAMAFQKAGFSLCETGGSCTAWRRVTAAGQAILVTGQDGCDATPEPGESYLVGLHSSLGGDVLASVTPGNEPSAAIGAALALESAKADHSLNVPQVEAALCIWEWMNDRANQRDATDGPIKALLDLWDGVGSGQMRMLAWQIAPAVESLYSDLCGEVGEDELRDVYPAYDWEFIPAVCLLLDWSGDMLKACYRAGDTIALPATVRPAMLAEFHSTRARLERERAAAADKGAALAEYKESCRRAAGRAWGYPDLVNDVPGSVSDAFEYGRDPDEWAQEAGKDADLNELDAYTAQDMARMYAEPVTA